MEKSGMQKSTIEIEMEKSANGESDVYELPDHHHHHHHDEDNANVSEFGAWHFCEQANLRNGNVHEHIVQEESFVITDLALLGSGTRHSSKEGEFMSPGPPDETRLSVSSTGLTSAIATPSHVLDWKRRKHRRPLRCCRRHNPCICPKPIR
jgi:hypothetical protein